MATRKKGWLRKGEKVIRVYGYSGNMRVGDIGTVAKDQEFPGVVKLVEWPDGLGHDPTRLRRLSTFKGFTHGEIRKLLEWGEHGLTGVFETIKLVRRVERRKKSA